MHLSYNVGYSKQPNLQKVSDLSQAPIYRLMKKRMYSTTENQCILVQI